MPIKKHLILKYFIIIQHLVLKRSPMNLLTCKNILKFEGYKNHIEKGKL